MNFSEDEWSRTINTMQLIHHQRYKFVGNPATHKRNEDLQSVSFRDLQEITSSVLPKQLASEGAIVITIDNKPFAIMVSLADENI